MSYVKINRDGYRCDIKNTQKAAVVFYKRDADLKRNWGDLDAIKSQCKQTDFFLYDIIGDIYKETAITGLFYPNLSKGTPSPNRETVIELAFKGDISKRNFSNYDFCILVDNETTVTAYHFRYEQEMAFSYNKKTSINILKAVMGGIPHYHEPIILEK